MALWATGSADSTFTVERFRQLDTDVSAFIDAVRDLNGEACALVKVVAPPDFAFSSPLGIVKRCDEVGDMALSAQRHQAAHHQASAVGRAARLAVRHEAGEPHDLRATPASAHRKGGGEA